MMNISFSSKIQQPSENIYPVIYKEDGIDYHSTIQYLRKINDNLPIIIEETYESRHDGLRLARLLRYSSFIPGCKIAFKPICVKLNTPITDLIALDPKNSILLTRNIFTTNVDDLLKINVWQSLTSDELLAILENNPIAASLSNHEHTNEWASIRLEYIIRTVLGKENKDDSFLRVNRDYLLYLFSLTYLRHKQTNKKNIELVQKKQDELQHEIKAFSGFLANKTNIKILLIDDDAKDKWHAPISQLLSKVSDKIYFESYPKENVFNEKESLSIALSNDWDLIICDLRLKNDDKKLIDPTEAEKISGIKLINEIKMIRKDLPLLAFTGSNKVWVHDIVIKQGIDGYYIKENPEYGVNDIGSIQKVVELLSVIRKLITKKYSNNYIWSLITNVQINKDDSNYLNKYFEISRVNPGGFVKARLEKIEELVLKAAGFVTYEPNAFQEKLFGHNNNKIAFLYLWAAMNEGLWLRYIFDPNPSEKRYYINNLSEKILYYDTSLTSVATELIKLDTYTKEDQKRNYHDDIIPNSKNFNKRSPIQNGFIWFLLLDNNDLIKKFNEIRRYRNTLDFIHGSTVDGRNDIYDETTMLKYLTQILREILFI